MDVIRSERIDPSQRFKKVREVSVGVSCGSDSLVHLHEMHCFPGDSFMGQSTKHEPWCMAAAQSHDESATRCDCFSRLGSDKDGSRLGGRFCIGMYFKFHCNILSSSHGNYLPVNVGITPSSGWHNSLRFGWSPRIRL